jgi:hypothetical protein
MKQRAQGLHLAVLPAHAALTAAEFEQQKAKILGS